MWLSQKETWKRDKCEFQLSMRNCSKGPFFRFQNEFIFVFYVLTSFQLPLSGKNKLY